jgi:hypothetical protein
VLQRQVDELDNLKASHYHEIVEHEAEVWNAVQSKVRLLVTWVARFYSSFPRFAWLSGQRWMFSIDLRPRRKYFHDVI